MISSVIEYSRGVLSLHKYHSFKLIQSRIHLEVDNQYLEALTNLHK